MGSFSFLLATEVRQKNLVKKGTFPLRERGAAVESFDDAALVTLSDGPHLRKNVAKVEIEPWSQEIYAGD